MMTGEEDASLPINKIASCHMPIAAFIRQIEHDKEGLLLLVLLAPPLYLQK
jgi:hypothetical protein